MSLRNGVSFFTSFMRLRFLLDRIDSSKYLTSEEAVWQPRPSEPLPPLCLRSFSIIREAVFSCRNLAKICV